MTEAEWLTNSDPMAILAWIDEDGHDPRRDKPIRHTSDRKLRLFAVAVCRHMWVSLTEEYPRRCVKFAERGADGERVATAMRRAARGYRAGTNSILSSNRIGLASCLDNALDAAHAVHREHTLLCPGQADARVVQSDILREIIGSPFQPSPHPDWLCGHCGASGEDALGFRDKQGANCRWCFRPIRQCFSWLPASVAPLIIAVYERRLANGALDPLRLAVLADAIEEAGCEEEGLLKHMREDGTHFRGCWALDVLLGRN